MIRNWTGRQTRTVVRVVLCAFLLGALLWSVYQVSASRRVTQSGTDPANIAAVHYAERGALGEPVLIEFYSEDCLICRQIQGTMAALDRQFENRTKFIYVDTDLPAAQPSVTRYDVRGLPTFVLLDSRGQPVWEQSGWPGASVLENALDTASRRD